MLLKKSVEKVSSLKLCSIVLLLDIIITFIMSMILFPESKYDNNLKIDSLIEKFLLIVLAAPLLETYIFQRLFLEGTILLTKQKIFSSIIVALFFGLSHWYSIPYIFKAFIAGLLYNFLYLNISGRKQNPFWYVTITHMCFNLFAFLFNEII